MKKILLMLAFAGMAMAANAQFVIGGQVGFSTDNISPTDHYINGTTDVTLLGDKQSVFTFMPKIGYNLNDKMQVGLSFGCTLVNTTYYNYSYPALTSTKDYYRATAAHDYILAPYFRYNIAQLGKFSLFCEAALSLGCTAKDKYHVFMPLYSVTGAYERDLDTTFVNDADYKRISLDFSIIPGFNYKFNEKCSMDIYIDLLRLGYHYMKITTGEYVDAANVKHLDESTAKGFYFGANATAETADMHLNNFRIGFNYHF